MEALLLCLCVISSGLAGTCPVPPTSQTSNGNNFCKGRLRRFRLPLLEATSTVVLRTKPSFPGCNSAILPSFQVLRFDFPSSISVTISLSATDCARLAPSLADLWCYLRSTTYSRFQRFQNWPSNLDKQRCLLVRSWTSVSSSSAVAHSSGMRRRKGFLCILWGYTGEWSRVQYTFHFHNNSQKLVIHQLHVLQNFLKTTFNTTNHVFEETAPPRR